MDSDRWKQVRELLAEGLEISEAGRASWLRSVCGDDTELEAEVQSLLTSASRTDIALDEPLLSSPAAPVPGPGERIGEYEIVRLIGQGGASSVFEAERAGDRNRVALKLPRPDGFPEGALRSRFLREARLASSLRHPNIVTTLETFEHEDLPVIVMELVEGMPLTERIPSGGMPVADVLAIACQVAEAAACAHDAGILHRDLKPANILLLESGLVKVLDFGAAKLASATESSLHTTTATGMIIGSPAYMSPEQAAGKPVGPPSDVFSFGALLYEMVTGRKAFSRRSVLATLSAVTREDPPPVNSLRPDAPGELRDLIGRCLRKAPEQRPAGMRDVLSILVKPRAWYRRILHPC